jgi:tRNA(Met) cytidine acetyltransferase
MQLTRDQRAAWRAILHCVSGHAHRPLLLQADRGRGKSTLLGIAALRLLQRGVAPIVVTAPSQAQAGPLLQAAGVASPRELPAGVRFFAPDALLREMPHAAVLLVDEAAALPLQLLQRLVRRYPRSIFSSTVHGYEGSGRGFQLRFGELLDRAAPGWQRQQLTQPVRWADEDPVEAAFQRLLLLDAEMEMEPDRQGAEIRFARVERDDLLRDETRLRAIFGLLVQAHYRTTPTDLRQLLDGGNLELWVAMQGAAVIGVALVALEGPLPAALHGPILRGERRPRGHLLPQVLAQHLGVERALGVRSLRIVRIAIHPHLRRQGLGRKLVEQVLYSHPQCDLAGASFGVSEEMLRFWGSLAMQAVRLGVRPEVASAAPSALVLRATSTIGAGVLQQARARFAAQFSTQLLRWHRQLDPQLVMVLLGGLCLPPPAGPVRDQLVAFAHGNRPFEAVFDLLRVMALHWLSGRQPVISEHGCLLVTLLLQSRDMAGVGAACGLTGRKQVIARLREAARQWLRAC